MLRALPLLLLLAACPAEPELDLLTPPSGPLSGYLPLSVDTAAAGVAPDDVLALHVGGIAVLLPEVVDGRVEGMFQGLPSAGPAEVVLTTAAGETTLDQAFEGLPPVEGPFDRVVAFGASLTQGVQDGTPTYEGTLDSPALAVARQLGAWHPQPMLVPGLFPTLALESVGPGPECETENVPDFIASALTRVLVDLAYPNAGGLAYELGRLDPHLEVRNVSAGNFQVDDMLLGSSPSELPQNVLGSLSFDPYAEFGAPPRWTMIEAVERLEPSLVLCFDLLGNDALSDASEEDMALNLPPLVQRLAETGAEVFLADMPDPALLEGDLGNGGDESERTLLAAAFNAMLVAEADRWPNVHVVPLAAEADSFLEDGIEVDGHPLGMGLFGGVLSFDGLHFSSTGYALVADLFVREINATLGTDVPAVDVASVLARDVHSPDAVRAAGRDPEECTGR